MKKILIFILVLLISLSFINAIGFSTIKMMGDTLGVQLPGELTKGLSQAQCALSFMDCLNSRIKGKLMEPITEAQQELFNSLDPAIRNAYDTYQKVNGYVAKGAQVIGELKLDSTGEKIVDGSIKFTENQNVGDLIGNELDKDEITVSKGMQFNAKDKKLVFTEPNSGVDMKGNSYGFKNVKAGDENTAYVKFDEEGNVIEADLTTNEKGSTFLLGGQKLELPANTKVIYKDGEIIISGESGKATIQDKYNSNDLNQNPRYIVDLKSNGNVQFKKEGIVVSGAIIEDTELHYYVTNNKLDPVLITNNIKNKGTYSNIVIANENGLSFVGSEYSIGLKEGNKCGVDMVDGKSTFVLNVGIDGDKTVGSLSDHRLDIMEGSIKLHTSTSIGIALQQTGLPLPPGGMLPMPVLPCESDIIYGEYGAWAVDGKTACISGDPLTVSYINKYEQTTYDNGESTTSICEGWYNPEFGSSTGDSIFDVITGRVIEWVTGGQTKPIGEYQIPGFSNIPATPSSNNCKEGCAHGSNPPRTKIIEETFQACLTESAQKIRYNEKDVCLYTEEDINAISTEKNKDNCRKYGDNLQFKRVCDLIKPNQKTVPVDEFGNPIGNDKYNIKSYEEILAAPPMLETTGVNTLLKTHFKDRGYAILNTKIIENEESLNRELFDFNNQLKENHMEELGNGNSRIYEVKEEYDVIRTIFSYNLIYTNSDKIRLISCNLKLHRTGAGGTLQLTAYKCTKNPLLGL